MRKLSYILFASLLISTVYAANYEITTDTYDVALALEYDDTLYMTNGGFDTLFLWDYSTATIEGTSPLAQGFGGIWNMNLFGENTSLNMSGGEVHEIAISGTFATARLSGGLIQRIWSSQYVTADPHITIVYSGEEPIYNTSTYLLTGLWGTGDAFSIYLNPTPEGQGYDPAIDNIQFELIPEPATICLMGVGVLLLKKRRVS